MIDIFFTIFVCIWFVAMAAFCVAASGIVIYELIKTIKKDE